MPFGVWDSKNKIGTYMYAFLKGTRTDAFVFYASDILHDARDFDIQQRPQGVQYCVDQVFTVSMVIIEGMAIVPWRSRTGNL